MKILFGNSRVKRSSSLSTAQFSGGRAFYASLGKREMCRNNKRVTDYFSGVEKEEILQINKKCESKDSMQSWLLDQTAAEHQRFKAFIIPSEGGGSEGETRKCVPLWCQVGFRFPLPEMFLVLTFTL